MSPTPALPCAGLSLALALLMTGCTVMPEQAAVAAPPPAPQTSAPADAQPAPLSRASMERQSAITATGYAVIGVQNHRNAPQQRLMAIRAAKIDAYRGLAEQVYGLHLDSSTTVSDFTVLSDSYRTRVEGVIYGATLTSITPVNQDTYEVTLTLDGTAINDLRLLYLNQFSGKRR